MPLHDHSPPARAVGSACQHWNFAAGATSGTFGPAVFLGRPYSAWALRAKLVGAGATSGAVRLYGTISMTSSEATSAFVALTTADLTAGSSDLTVFVTGAPCNLIAPQLNVPTSGLTSVDVWAAGVP